MLTVVCFVSAMFITSRLGDCGDNARKYLMALINGDAFMRPMRAPCPPNPEVIKMEKTKSQARVIIMRNIAQCF